MHFKKVSITEGSNFTALARLVNVQNDLVTQSMVNSSNGVSVSVYDVTSVTPAAALFSDSAITRSDVVLSTISFAGEWEEDDDGFNFRHTLQHDSSNSSGPNFQGGHVFKIVYQLQINANQPSPYPADVLSFGYLLSVKELLSDD